MNNFKFRVWDKKNNKYLTDQSAITNDGLLIKETYYIDKFQVLNSDDYEIEYCTGYKDVDGKYLYVNDFVEFKLGLKMVRGRIIYDNFAFWVYEFRGGIMAFTQQKYISLGNYNENKEIASEKTK